METLGVAGIVVLVLSLIPFALHTRAYGKLLRSIKARGIDVGNLEAGFLDYGFRGFIRKIRIIEGEYLLKGKLSKEEKGLLYSSRRAYYAMAPFLLGFIAVITIVLLQAK